MKKILLLLTSTLPVVLAHSAIITWTGLAMDGKWSTAGNWSPATVPGLSDDVLFTGVAVIVQMDIIPGLSPFTYVINSLKITNNANVELQRLQAGGGLRVLQVRSTSAITKGLQVDAGSVLFIHGINTNVIGDLEYILDLGGAVGVTGEIGGELQFSGAGSGGTADETRLRVYMNASSNAALVVKSGGVIKYFELTGNTTSNPGAWLTMENGSTYWIEKNGGSFPDGVWQPNSLAKVNNPAGVNGPLFNGASYGNLEWNCPSQDNYVLNRNISFNMVHFISTGTKRFRIKSGVLPGDYVMTIGGDLEIDNNSIVELVNGSSAPQPGSGKIVLKGDLIIHPLGMLTTSGGALTTSQIELNGSSNQDIAISGSLSGTKLEFIMNGVSATLLTPVTLPGNNSAANANLQLQNGRIVSTATNILTMIDNSGWSGASTNSFVAGPMRKIGDEAFVFPIGEGLEYAPIAIGAAVATTDEYIAQYSRGDPRSIIGPDYQVPVINHISSKEWWTLDRSGSDLRSVTLYTRTYTEATLLSDLRVVRWNGSTMWVDEGNTAFSGTPGNGTVASNVPVSGFLPQGIPTPFTFASTTATENPLPLTLISFNARRLSETQSMITWELGNSSYSSIRFEVERAEINKAFASIATIIDNSGATSFSYIDHSIGKGIYYRLKIVDQDGNISYSRVVAVIYGSKNAWLIWATPVQADHVILSITSSVSQKLDLLIMDMQGKMLKRQNITVNSGTTTIDLFVPGLAAGIYHVTGMNANGKTNTLRFLK